MGAPEAAVNVGNWVGRLTPKSSPLGGGGDDFREALPRQTDAVHSDPMTRRWIPALLCTAALAACATAQPEPMDHSAHAAAETAAAPQALIRGVPPGLKGPVLNFEEANVAFYVEMDGTHLVAVNNNGEMMWRREPYVEFPSDG